MGRCFLGVVGPFAGVAELIAAGLKAPVCTTSRKGCVLGSEGSCMPDGHHGVAGRPLVNTEKQKEIARGCART